MKPVNLPVGKQAMLWLPKDHIGSPEQVVALAKQLGLVCVSLKVANGNLLYEGLSPYVSALRSEGIRVVGWHYLFCGVRFPDRTSSEWVETGVLPETEAHITREAVFAYSLDGIELDVEREFKVFNQAERARRYLLALQPLNVPIGLCSYRFPRSHLEIPWATFLDGEFGVDYVNPQVYWGPTKGPVVELEESYRQHQALFTSYGVRPYFPVGRAYIGDGYPVPGPSYSETQDFLRKAYDLGMPGASFWSLDHLTLPTHSANQVQRKQAIADFQWGEVTPPPVPVSFSFLVNTGTNVRNEPGTQGGDITVCAAPIKSRLFKNGKEVLGPDGKIWFEAKVYIRSDLCRKI